jgi:4-amino-4-deoxy-L-arabinose transferase-like glycosyltransferase
MPATLFHPRSFVEAVHTRPARLFWVFALVHLVLWTVIPSLTSPNAPLDVIEGYAWGREWLLGTYKHPPMQSWWLQILAVLTGRAAWAHFLASQIAIVVAFWAVWQTGREMMSETAAIVGVMLLEGIIYYNFTSTEFNPNVLQLPFWALASRSFYRGIKDNHLSDWFLLGIWGAGGLYSKYSTGLLLITLAGFLFLQPQARVRLKSVGPYLALVVMAGLFLPHVFWLMHSDFLPLHYALDRLQSTPKPHILPTFIFSSFVLIFGQFLALIGILLLFLVFFGRNGTSKDSNIEPLGRDFLHAVTFGPFALTFITIVVFGFKMHDMWGTPFWNFAGLWAISRFHPSFSSEALTRFVYVWSTIFLGMLFVCGIINILYPYIESRTMRVHFPGHELAERMTDEWHQRYHAPLRFAVGDTWAAGNVGYYAAERPHVFILGDRNISPWIKTYDFDKYGGVVVWCVRHCLGSQEEAIDPPDFVKEKFPEAQIQEHFFLARQTEADVPPVKMGWAIIPPKP